MPGTRVWGKTNVYAMHLFEAERLEGNVPSDAGHGEVKAIFFFRGAEAQGQMLSHTPAPLWHKKLEMQADIHFWGENLKMVHCNSGSNAVFDTGKKCCGAKEKGYVR